MAALGMLKRFDKIPKRMLYCEVTELFALLGGPSLFYLEGQRSPPLFITILQHGNEPTGFDAMQKILRKYDGARLPRSVWLFVANVEAAGKGLRVLDHQGDYNRAWPGTQDSASAEAHLMAQVVEIVTENPLFASIDIHNNTGFNPHYGCINRQETSFFHLAALFARTTVYFRQPVGVQSLAMANHCPAVTLECGQAGQHAALDHAFEYIDACLHMHHLSEHKMVPADIHLLETVAVVKMAPGVSFGFEGASDFSASDVCFRPDLDKHNFGLLRKGDRLGRVLEGAGMPIQATANGVQDITAEVFEISGGQLLLKKDIIPSMATLDMGVIRQDCLFYLMQEKALPQ